MYEASRYSSENENKLVEIGFIKNYIVLYQRGGGGGFIVTGGFGRDLNSIDNLEVKYEMSGS